MPHGFVQVMKASIKSVAPAFSARRMVKDYTERFYIQVLGLAGGSGKSDGKPSA